MPPTSVPTGLHATVARGENKGELLFPHRHDDGNYVVSPDKFEKNYVRIANLADLPGWVVKGYRLRMSNPAVGINAPSLIMPSSVRGWQ